MSVLSIGQPRIEIAKLDKNDNIGPWVEVDVPKDGTTNLETQEGDKQEFLQEGGGKVDVDVKESGYTFVFDLYAKKGKEKPIPSRNGVVVDNYAVRLSPKDPESKGMIIYKTQVSCLDSYSVADGMIWQYKFEGLQTDDHENIWDEFIRATHLESDVNFVDVPGGGGTAKVNVTIGSGDTVTTEAGKGDTWISATNSKGEVTITAAANTGARREGWLKIMTDDGHFCEIRVNQAMNAVAATSED